MGDYYEGAYKNRLNRYGLNYQSRIQGQRERNFDNYLYKTIYRVDFEFDGQLHPGSLERNKQDYTETVGYLLTKLDLKIPNGTVLMIESLDSRITPWMVWWLEQIETSGYNRYIVLKMTHEIQCTKDEGGYQQWAYFSGPGTSAIQDALKSSSAKPLYFENNNLYTFVTSYNKNICKDDYFEVTEQETTLGYKIKELDISSTPGVAYVSADPIPLRSGAAAPKQTPTDNYQDYFWLNGGIQ